MKTLHKYLLVFMCPFALVGCGGDSGGDDFEPAPFRTQAEVTADFEALDIQPGINDFTLETLTPGVFWSFRVVAPADASDNNKRPLVIDLHGGSGNSSPTAHQSMTDCYVQPGLDALNAYVLSPNSGAGEWFDVSNQNQVLILLQLATSTWHIDINKILLTGYSNGGNGAWFFADFFPQFFSAGIAMASSYDSERADGSVPKINIPLYVIHSNDDEVFPVAITEGFVDKSLNAGSTIEFVKVDGLTHNQVCDFDGHLQTAVDWVLNEVW